MSKENNDQKIVLTIKNILNLCVLAGISVNKELSAHSEDDEDEMSTEIVIAQNKHGTVAWFEELPEEGVMPLGDHSVKNEG